VIDNYRSVGPNYFEIELGANTRVFLNI